MQSGYTARSPAVDAARAVRLFLFGTRLPCSRRNFELYTGRLHKFCCSVVRCWCGGDPCGVNLEGFGWVFCWWGWG
jgi:hypothetical protein